ncbi:DNA repair protein RecO [Achromobacter sp. F4_2707]|uniref:DNA repair protein RecO n=1 Tax=Achromobacter sp. F4_2707 TaxID=3114286 RepID=UPI0039C61DF4
MSSRAQRVRDVKAYMLHASAWRETSLIVQIFSREHGNVAMVAKGAKRPYSALRPVLAAFQPLIVSWTGTGEVKTLTRADLTGIRPLAGRSLMSAWYMNELLLRLLPREDPHPVLYDAYDAALQALEQGAQAASALRSFEWTLLEETGYGFEGEPPQFDDPIEEKRMRAVLRERLDELLGRPLRTRQVMLDLRRYS